MFVLGEFVAMFKDRTMKANVDFWGALYTQNKNEVLEPKNSNFPRRTTLFCLRRIVFF